jgi:hypothetical protein
MPRATVDVTATKRVELKSLPARDDDEVGFVELRKLAYGQILERRDMSAKIAIEGLGDTRTRTEADDIKVTTEMIQRAVTEFEFKNCIVTHNLEDEHGTLLNFSNPANVHALDPQVGQEVSELIDEMNQWDSDLRGKDETTSEAGLELV